MAYATQSDLEARLEPQLLVLLADDDEDEVADTAVLAAALDDAMAQIDQTLAERYETPVSAPPPIFKRWCVDLAAANLFARKKAEMPTGLSENVQLTRRALEAIAGGLAGLAGAQPKLAAFESESSRRGEEAIFSPEALAEY